MRLAGLLFDLYYGILYAACGAWVMLFDSTRDERREARERERRRTERIIAIVRSDQRHPAIVERNLAARFRREMVRGRENQIARLYREMEMGGE